MPVDTFLAFATRIWFQRVYMFHLHVRGHVSCLRSKDLVSKNLHVPFACPLTRLLLSQQGSGVQESTSSICVSMDTSAAFAARIWCSRIYMFHLHVHGHVWCFRSKDLVSKSLHLLFACPWTLFLLSQQGSGVLESTTSICLSVDAFV
jgi:hypothetical protein